VASATCYALRLHVSAAPPRGGLTQALGPYEIPQPCHSVALYRWHLAHRQLYLHFIAHCVLHCCRAAYAGQRHVLRQSHANTCQRHPHFSHWLGYHSNNGIGSPQTVTSSSYTRQRHYWARGLTIRSSRAHVVASATCLRYASTRPPPRHGPA